jgi:TonB family protein
MWKCEFQRRRSHPRRRLVLLAVTVIAVILGSAAPAPSQTSNQNAGGRKIVTRVEPEYPETLKRLYIGGVVRVEAVVAASGTVESMQLLGGSPILGQSAMKAIKQWKYAPAARKEKIVVQLEFDPHR